MANLGVVSMGAVGNGTGSASVTRGGTRRVLTALGAVSLVAMSPALIGAPPAAVGAPGSGVTTVVSVSSAGVQGLGANERPTISADGNLVAFQSDASNLVLNDDNNGAWDVFVHNMTTGMTELVSVSSREIQANANAMGPVISANGRYVAFSSEASDLAPNDTNSASDVFVRDLVNGTTQRVSVSGTGSQSNGTSNVTAISAGGRYVAFGSDATNLVANDTNDTWDVFVRDRSAGTTERMSVSSSGTQANAMTNIAAISAHGRFVAFHTFASNLVPGDTNGIADVFVRDRSAGTTERVSVSSSGAQAGNGESAYPTISANGRFVAFHSTANNLVATDSDFSLDAFLRDRLNGTTRRMSIGANGQRVDGAFPSISAGGRFVAFTSTRQDWVPGDPGALDVFVRDRRTRTTELVSVRTDGTYGNDVSTGAAISGDGRYVAFHSLASNLTTDDTNNTWDVFRRDRGPL
jgi:hypothetical protein